VETLKVVVEIESPVRVDEIIPRARSVERDFVERESVEPGAHRRDQLVERHRGRERDHEEAGPATERDRWQVV